MANDSDKTILQLPERAVLTGAEAIPFEDAAGNGHIKASQLQGKDGKDGEWLGMKIVEQTEATATIAPDVLNRWGEAASLTIDFEPSKEGYAGEYCIEFISGATPTSLSLPDSVVFPDEPTIEANTRYQISVVNNVGLIVGVAV